jgi:uncharacterized membrane protein
MKRFYRLKMVCSKLQYIFHPQIYSIFRRDKVNKKKIEKMAIIQLNLNLVISWPFKQK